MFSFTILELLYEVRRMRRIATLFLFDLRETFNSIPWILLSWLYFAFQFAIYGHIISSLVVTLDNYLFYYASGLLLMIVFNSASWAGRDFVESAHEGRLRYLLSIPITRGQFFLERMLLGITVNFFQLTPPLVFVLWATGLLTLPVLLSSMLTIAAVSMSIMGLMISLSVIAFKSFDIYSAIVAGLSALLIRFSTVLYPLSYMPQAFATISVINPMTYGADLLRNMLQFDATILLDANMAATVVVAFALSTIFAGMMLLSKTVEGVKST